MLNKNHVEKFTEENKNIIISTKLGSIAGKITNVDDNFIEIIVGQCSYIGNDDTSSLKSAIIPINQIISICTFELDLSKLPEN